MTTRSKKMGTALLVPTLTTAVLLGTPGAASATSSRIVFYEGNGGDQEIVHVVSDGASFDGRPDQNDEARSVVLHNVRAGTVITVWDSGDKKQSKREKDDYTTIEVKESAQEYTVRTFERTYTDDTVNVTYTRRNGLDGKVSYINVDHM